MTYGIEAAVSTIFVCVCSAGRDRTHHASRLTVLRHLSTPYLVYHYATSLLSSPAFVLLSKLLDTCWLFETSRPHAIYLIWIYSSSCWVISKRLFRILAWNYGGCIYRWRLLTTTHFLLDSSYAIDVIELDDPEIRIRKFELFFWHLVTCNCSYGRFEKLGSGHWHILKSANTRDRSNLPFLRRVCCSLNVLIEFRGSARMPMISLSVSLLYATSSCRKLLRHQKEVAILATAVHLTVSSRPMSRQITLLLAILKLTKKAIHSVRHMFRSFLNIFK